MCFGSGMDRLPNCLAVGFTFPAIVKIGRGLGWRDLGYGSQGFPSDCDGQVTVIP